MTGYVGDNDPMDIFDISSVEPGHVGEIRTVKILGGLAMIDDDKTDFKVIAVDVRDPLSKVVESKSSTPQLHHNTNVPSRRRSRKVPTWDEKDILRLVHRKPPPPPYCRTANKTSTTKSSKATAPTPSSATNSKTAPP